MKILMISPLYYPSIGGVQKHVRKLSSLLHKRGVKVTVVAPQHTPNIPLKEKRDGIQIIRIPFGYDSSLLRTYRWFIANREHFATFDIVHIHDPVPLVLWYLPLIFLNRVPVYATFHGFERDPIPFRFIILRKIARFLVQGTICIGRFIEQLYKVKCDKISIGAITPKIIRVQEKQGIVFVGRLERDTGIFEYIEVMKILQEKYDIILDLTICGAGKEEDKIRTKAERMNLPVHFRGLVEDPSRYSAASKICFAGGFLSILESMLQGTPVLSIARTSLKYHYLKSATSYGAPLSIHLNPESAAKEISLLIRNEKKYSELSEKGQMFALEHTWENLVDEYVRLWRR
ncbi:MAG: glycosyltransferase [Candidatus Lokiarchaeota archaeon]|nr:glycosyltransferase [Candidatus Lokiarchaeota archaeon]